MEISGGIHACHKAKLTSNVNNNRNIRLNRILTNVLGMPILCITQAAPKMRMSVSGGTMLKTYATSGYRGGQNKSMRNPPKAAKIVEKLKGTKETHPGHKRRRFRGLEQQGGENVKGSDDKRSADETESLL